MMMFKTEETVVALGQSKFEQDLLHSKILALFSP